MSETIFERAQGRMKLNTASVTATGVVGIPTLDTTGKIASAQMPTSVVGAIQYQGTWNANTNTPTLVASTGTKGWYYVVSTAGTTSLDSVAQWSVGDWIIFNGTVWQKVDNTSLSDVLTGFSATTGTITAADTILTAFNKCEGRLALDDAKVTYPFTLNGDGRQPTLAGLPTILKGTAAGTGAAATIAGKDNGGLATVNVTTGITGVLATVTFHTAYTAAPVSVVLTAGDAATGAVIANLAVTSIGTTTFVISCVGTGLANGTYNIYYGVHA